MQAQCGTLSGNELICNLSGNTRPQLSQLAEPLWTDPGPKSGISVRDLLSTSKKRKKEAHAGNEWSNIFPKFSLARKKPQPSLAADGTGSDPLSGIVIRQTDFVVIIGQCVVSDRNLACAILLRHMTLTSPLDSVLYLISLFSGCVGLDFERPVTA